MIDQCIDLPLNVEKAASLVCRNPKHLSQTVEILVDSVPDENLTKMSVDALVNHWWNKQLFLSIKP